MSTAQTPEPEVAALLAALDAQRAHVLAAVDGLDDEQLRRPVLPSGWTCLGLVRHLTLDDERFWFRAVVAGERAVIDELAPGSPEAWDVPEGTSTREVLDAYRHEVGLANAIVTATPADAAPAWWPEGQFGDFRLETVREVLLHVITETACHAGHLDAVREMLDGNQRLVIDGGRRQAARPSGSTPGVEAPLVCDTTGAWQRARPPQRSGGTTASASISTSRAGSIRAVTPSIVEAGRTVANTSPWARPTSVHRPMSVTKMRVRTTSSIRAPTSCRASAIRCSASRACS